MSWDLRMKSKCSGGLDGQGRIWRGCSAIDAIVAANQATDVNAVLDALRSEFCARQRAA